MPESYSNKLTIKTLFIIIFFTLFQASNNFNLNNISFMEITINTSNLYVTYYYISFKHTFHCKYILIKELGETTSLSENLSSFRNPSFLPHIHTYHEWWNVCYSLQTFPLSHVLLMYMSKMFILKVYLQLFCL